MTANTFYIYLHLSGNMRQSGLLQREGKASLRTCQGRAYGGCGKIFLAVQEYFLHASLAAVSLAYLDLP